MTAAIETKRGERKVGKKRVGGVKRRFNGDPSSPQSIQSLNEFCQLQVCPSSSTFSWTFSLSQCILFLSQPPGQLVVLLTVFGVISNSSSGQCPAPIRLAPASAHSNGGPLRYCQLKPHLQRRLGKITRGPERLKPLISESNMGLAGVNEPVFQPQSRKDPHRGATRMRCRHCPTTGCSINRPYIWA